MITPANDISRSLKKSFSIKKGSLYDGQKYLRIKNVDVLEIGSTEGANAIIYKGKDLLLDRDVAIKVWCRIDRSEKDRLLKAKKESSKIANLDHPSIVKIYYADVLHNYPILVSEFIYGETLKQWLEGGPSPFNRILIWDQIADALNYCDKKGVIHNDLHSKNIMIVKVDKTNKAILLDFGTSIFASSPSSSRERACKVLLKTGDAIFYDIEPSKMLRFKKWSNLTYVIKTIDFARELISYREEIFKKSPSFSNKEGNIWRLTMLLADTPIFNFEMFEHFISEYCLKEKKQKRALNFFYDNIYAYCKTKRDFALNGSVGSSLIPVGVKRNEALKKYLEWSNYYIENKWV